MKVFLGGPRQVEPSRQGNSPTFDLLDSATYPELAREPSRIEARVGPGGPGTWVCFDEVQKLPSLLDTVHRLIEARRWRFALSGPSARTLKRGGANLLGGRAVTRHLGPFTSAELGDAFDADEVTAWGALPLVVLSPTDRADILSLYLHTYIRASVKRSRPRVMPVSQFLRRLHAGEVF
jgi:predicted AAA+ superfamily ATPase